MHPRTKKSRIFASAGIAALVAFSVSFIGVSPAAASTAPDFATLVSELSSNGVDSTVTLTADIVTTADDLLVERTVTVDLNGYTLTSATVDLTAGVTLTIDDSSPGETGEWASTNPSEFKGAFQTTGATLTIDGGTVTAISNGRGAGIGGGFFEDGGATNITGGVVYAKGSSFGAGIGGGERGTGGVTNISGGTVTTLGGGNAAGIGGGGQSTVGGGTTTITGGVVDARGNQGSAGIGGGYGAPAGTILITGGTVTAVGGSEAGGIGSGRYAASAANASSSITITGGTVTATGGTNGAGIGGGQSGGGTPTTITGGTVTAVGSSGGAGIGTGSPASGTHPLTLGTAGEALSLSATSLRTTSTTVVAGATVTIPAAGSVSVESDMTNNGVIVVDGALTGTSSITNNGAIRPATNVDASSMAITVNNFDITFVANDAGAAPASAPFRAYAATLGEAGYVTSGISYPGYVVDSWNTESDGSGTTVSLTTAIAPETTAGAVTLYATWVPQELALVSGSPESTIDGTVTTFVSELSGDLGTSTDVSATATLTSDDGADVAVGDSVTFPTAGARTITSTYAAFTATLPVTVAVGALASVTITPSASSVAEGDTLSFAVSGVDAGGSAVTIAASDVVLTSSVPTDVVSGLDVTFPTASPHTITATVGGMSDSVTIQVSAFELAATGGVESEAFIGLGLLLAAAGGILLYWGRRRSRA